MSETSGFSALKKTPSIFLLTVKSSLDCACNTSTWVGLCLQYNVATEIIYTKPLLLFDINFWAQIFQTPKLKKTAIKVFFFFLIFF